mgnify:FL=1|jgi:hypothetical protein
MKCVFLLHCYAFLDEYLKFKSDLGHWGDLVYGIQQVGVLEPRFCSFKIGVYGFE